jgi:penicillin-binding protein 1A
MDYAHHGIELRPIPGIANPLPTGNRPTPSESAPNKAADGSEIAALTRPRTLSPEATRLLQEIADKLKQSIAADSGQNPLQEAHLKAAQQIE